MQRDLRWVFFSFSFTHEHWRCEWVSNYNESDHFIKCHFLSEHGAYYWLDATSWQLSFSILFNNTYSSWTWWREGQALKQLPREKVQVATKCGIAGFKLNDICIKGTPEYVRECCKGSLARLDVEYIDLYYLHRIDQSVPIEETVCICALALQFWLSKLESAKVFQTWQLFSYTRLDEWAQGAGPRRESQIYWHVWSKRGYHKACTCSSPTYGSADRVVSMGQRYRGSYSAIMQVCLFARTFQKSMFVQSHLCHLECFHISSLMNCCFSCNRWQNRSCCYHVMTHNT